MSIQFENTCLSEAMPIDPRNQSPGKYISATEELGIPRGAALRVLGTILDRAERCPSKWNERGIVSKAHAKMLSCPSRLALESIETSKKDNFQKILFRTHDNLSLETVIIPLHKTGCVTICLSSQVGCAMGCVFCATGRMERRRNLETWEIVEQFIEARQFVRSTGRRVTGAVFMGMGEPFLNYNRVLAAAELLCFPVAGAINSKAITVSTVGLVREIDRFTEEKRRFRLSVSLGAADDDKRRSVFPIAGRTPIVHLMAAVRRHAAARRGRVNLAYVCISGFNVGEEDARNLATVVGDIPVRLDLIDVTDLSGRFLPPSETELRKFRDALSIHLRQPVARRYSGGADIAAACGTLAGKAEIMAVL